MSVWATQSYVSIKIFCFWSSVRPAVVVGLSAPTPTSVDLKMILFPASTHLLEPYASCCLAESRLSQAAVDVPSGSCTHTTDSVSCSVYDVMYDSSPE